MLHNHCFQFLQMFLIIYSYLLSNAAVTREIEDNVYAKFWGG